MNQKKAVIGIVCILLAVHLGGCIEKDALKGTYKCSVDDGVLYLHDGEYEMLIDEKYGGGGAYGTYTTLGDKVLLKMEFLGIIAPFSTDGHDLIDQDGDRWVRD